MRERYPGLRGMFREMFKDSPEDYKNPEDIDAEADAEQDEQEDPDEVTDYIPANSTRAEEEMRDAEETLKDLRFGIIVISLICLIPGIFLKPHWRYLCGVAIGCALALFLVGRMYRSVSTAVMLAPDGAVRYSRKQAVARYLLTCAVYAVTMFFGGVLMGAGTIAASFSIKPAAYLHSMFRRLRRRIMIKEADDNGAGS